MKLTNVTLYASLTSSIDTKKKQQPTYFDCLKNGAALDPAGVDGIECNSRTLKCSVTCKDGMQKLGAKYFKCKKNRQAEYYLHPASKVPVCKSCRPIRDLLDMSTMVVEDKLRRGKVDYIVRCQDGQFIQPYKQRVMKLKCICDKKSRTCNYKYGKEWLSDDMMTGLECPTADKEEEEIEKEQIFVEGDRIPPNLVCDDTVRIVGGQEAERESWPWIVQLHYYGYPFCGGSILDENTIVTAAHCCDVLKNVYYVRGIIGQHKRLHPDTGHTFWNPNLDDGAQYVEFDKIIMHPLYDTPNANDHDICLMTTKKPMTLNRQAARVCLPKDKSNMPKPDQVCWTAGWGRMMFQGKASDVLHDVDIKIISDDQCSTPPSAVRGFFDSKVHTCAGSWDGGRDSCQGDSGGPLICAEKGKPVLRGITSMGYKCAAKYAPGLYTRVENYLTWINETMSTSPSQRREVIKQTAEDLGVNKYRAKKHLAQVLLDNQL